MFAVDYCILIAQVFCLSQHSTDTYTHTHTRTVTDKTAPMHASASDSVGNVCLNVELTRNPSTYTDITVVTISEP